MKRSTARRITTSIVTLLALSAGAVSLAAPANAANVAIKFNCSDPNNTFQAHVTMNGSGEPKAKYDVDIQIIDKRSDGLKPKLRLVSFNYDGTTTEYPWHSGNEGAGVILHTSSTLQNSHGLKAVVMQATSKPNDSFYTCSDYQPKSA
ncbi:hypothetical protein [Streptomyces aureus]|uniref:hypothetical protein n=1 Tax=Streptomyces aureus TaxID=193461 RepID=UPI00055A8629|nr:hypothetical protein [Streptomyces aureus]